MRQAVVQGLDFSVIECRDSSMLGVTVMQHNVRMGGIQPDLPQR